ncbi:MAG: hypothetical protein WCA13_08525 [Terriglobales bacterium]
MTLSIHDNLLVSYEVQCEQRTITLRTEYRDPNKPREFTNVVFKGVQAYHFYSDAFGNIIFDVANIPAEQFIKEFGVEISELYRMNGSPTWAADLVSAPEYLREQGIKAFILSASLGLSGWVLAHEISVASIQPARGNDVPQDGL